MFYFIALVLIFKLIWKVINVWWVFNRLIFVYISVHSVNILYLHFCTRMYCFCFVVFLSFVFIFGKMLRKWWNLKHRMWSAFLKSVLPTYDIYNVNNTTWWSVKLYVFLKFYKFCKSNIYWYLNVSWQVYRKEKQLTETNWIFVLQMFFCF